MVHVNPPNNGCYLQSRANKGLTENNTMIQLYCMNYVTTNIRISEEDYLRLKAEAEKERKSLSGVIREKIKPQKKVDKSPQKILARIRQAAKRNAKYHVKGVDSVKIFREMRYEGKW